MSIFEHLKGISLAGFLDQHPRIGAIVAEHVPADFGVRDPRVLLAAASAYNQHAFYYVCELAGALGRSRYRHRHLVSSQVLAAASIEEGGQRERSFLDPHASLRMWMLEVLWRDGESREPAVPFAHEAGRRMGQIYLWRSADLPDVPDPFGAMLGAHFASEYLAGAFEFSTMVSVLSREHPEVLSLLRAAQEPTFGFSAAEWLEGHPQVELEHAAYAARAAEAAAWQIETPEPFWHSFYVGLREFCRNDQEYFRQLAAAV